MISIGPAISLYRVGFTMVRLWIFLPTLGTPHEIVQIALLISQLPGHKSATGSIDDLEVTSERPRIPT